MTKIQIWFRIKAAWRWVRLFLSAALWMMMTVIAYYHRTAQYLLIQARGQIRVVMNTMDVSEYARALSCNSRQWKNINEVEKIKRFAFDSLGFTPVKNYRSVVVQNGVDDLWVLTASRAYSLQAYEWSFPVLGQLNYKGYFDYRAANTEYNHLLALGYDAELRPVTAYSTLGWLSDPLTARMLDRSRENFCELIFHELFHSTYYKAGAADINENLAVFVARKATLLYLEHDSLALGAYLRSKHDDKLLNAFMRRKTKELEKLYEKINADPQRLVLKLSALLRVADSLQKLPLHNKNRGNWARQQIMRARNAWFIDYKQYDALQDSLEDVFNKFYGGRLKKLVQDLRQNGIYY